MGDSPEFSTPAPGDVVVTGRNASGGFSIFGLDLTDPTHTVDVTFTVPEECVADIGHESRWPSDDPLCAGPIDVAGPVSGSGRTADGLGLVSVRITVTRECHEAIAIGAPWPAQVPACA